MNRQKTMSLCALSIGAHTHTHVLNAMARDWCRHLSAAWSFQEINLVRQTNTHNDIYIYIYISINWMRHPSIRQTHITPISICINSCSKLIERWIQYHQTKYNSFQNRLIWKSEIRDLVVPKTNLYNHSIALYRNTLPWFNFNYNCIRVRFQFQILPNYYMYIDWIWSGIRFPYLNLRVHNTEMFTFPEKYFLIKMASQSLDFRQIKRYCFFRI